jgi:Clp amino terminal domain, pathogenicity island component
MGYRGEDLDLRTPQTWSATPADLAGSSDTATYKNGQRVPGRNGPIWVDDTVLACANHAFDVALAHRAGEVRVEHFLHALTRIDAAAEALEGRGVRVAALRRESATIIASEIPVGLPNGKGAPRRSEELAELLRQAAVSAARRNGPATIEDVINVLFDQRADFPGLALLGRHTMRAPVRESLEQFPPLSRYAEPPRYVAPPVERYVRVSAPEPVREVVREVVREPVRETVRVAAPVPPPEPVRYVQEPARTYRTEYAGTPTDTIQNTRIEALEQMVRALGNDLASERQVVSGMLKDISRQTQAQRDDQGQMHTGLYDRLQMLEQVMTENRTGVPSGVSADGLAEQLLNLELSIEQRLKDLSQGWASFSTRLQGIESTVRQPAAAIDSGQIAERVARAIDMKPIISRLDDIEESLQARDTGNSGNTGVDIVDRLKSLEGEIARALSANTASTGRMESLISGFERQKPDLSGPFVERVNALSSAYQGHAAANSDAAAKIVERLAAVERALTGEIETAAAKHQAYAQDLGEVHDALMKLNQNQHTLAGSIDQWRTEAAGDVSTISTRLANLDRDNERPIETLNALTTHMDTMNRMMIERYHRRNRFWYWLFGTDDWIGKSWPSQAEAIEIERQRLKAPQNAR